MPCPCLILWWSTARRDPAHHAQATIDGDKADVWATGITMVTCILGYFPWACAHTTDPAFLHWCTSWSTTLAQRARLGVSPSAQLHPTEARALFTILHRCCGGEAVSDRGSVSPLLAHLLVAMLDPRPDSRPSMRDVAAHPWFQRGGASASAESLASTSAQPSTPSTTTSSSTSSACDGDVKAFTGEAAFEQLRDESESPSAVSGLGLLL